MVASHISLGAARLDALDLVRPYFVCRVSGLPVTCVDALTSELLAGRLADLELAECELDGRRKLLSATLHDAVGRTRDRQSRNSLIRLRRDLFNLRQARRGDLATAVTVLAAHEWQLFGEYQDLLARRSAAVQDLGQTHAQELQRTRRFFREMIGDEDFCRGLMLSSRSLHDALNRYRSTAPERMHAREAQIERGLLRYFTRAAMKATPFGRFCAVIPGLFDIPRSNVDLPERSPLRFYGNPRRKEGFVRLNKRLFGLLWSHLKMRPAVRRELVLELTPTLSQRSGYLHFLSVVDGQETFQRLERDNVLDALVPVLKARSGRRYRELVAFLLQDPRFEATAIEASTYVDRLLGLGLLRIRTGIRTQEADWDVRLASLLDPIDDDDARVAVSLLRSLRANLSTYESAASPVRHEIVSTIRASVSAICEAWAMRAEDLRDLPFFEDATAAAELRVSTSEEVIQALEDLNEWAGLVLGLASTRSEQATMRHFFDERHGGAGTPVRLLEFYELFLSEHLLAHLEKERDARASARRPVETGYDVSNPFGLESVGHVVKARTAIVELLRSRWAANDTADEIVLTRDELGSATASVDQVPDTNLSASVFCQVDATCGAAGGGARFIVKSGGLWTGNGKYFSRFLYMFSGDVRRQLLYANHRDNDPWRAEICMDEHFNANLHQPVMDWEISYPTAEGGSSARELACTDLDVAPAEDDPHALWLLHRPTGRRVVPFDLGFENPRKRPPLFQFLARFCPVGAFTFPLPESPERTGEPVLRTEHAREAVHEGADSLDAPVPIQYRPRITFQGSIVLARRRWLIPASGFPRPQPGETDPGFFLRVNRWRAEHGIPAQAYVKIRPTPAARTKDRPQGEMPDGHGTAGREPQRDDEPHPDAPSPLNEAILGRAAADGDDHGAEAATAKPSPHTRSQEGFRRPPRDWGKPQFIDFQSPLLVDLFGRIPGELEHFVAAVEEVLPALDSLPTTGGERYSTELILELRLGRRLGQRGVATA